MTVPLAYADKATLACIRRAPKFRETSRGGFLYVSIHHGGRHTYWINDGDVRPGWRRIRRDAIPYDVLVQMGATMPDRVRDNPTAIDHVNNFVGDFVNDHPWISALIGGTALGAAGYIGVLITQAVIRQTPASSTITTDSSDTSKGPTSTSTTTSTSSSSSTPTYDASKAVPLYIQNAGKEVAVGTSLVLMDAHTGQVVNGAVEGSDSVLAAGPTTGTFVAIGAGSVKLYAPDGSSTTVVVKATAGAAGVAISPKRPMPHLRGLTSLLVGPALASRA